MTEIVPNFYVRKTDPKPEPVTTGLIQWINDPDFRRDYGMWLYERFNSLTAEYQKHKRFLSLKEIEDIL